MFSHIKAVFFDLDGTLIDSAPDLAVAANKMRTDRSMPALPLALYRPMTGTGARGMLDIAFGMTAEHKDFSEYKEEFFSNYETCMIVKTHAFSGVEKLINSLLSAEIPWGIVTNKSSRFALPITKHMPLFNSASALVCGDTTAYSKPHPAPLFEAARQLGVEPHYCVYVGDDERDMIAGRAAGMMVIAAAYGYLGLTTRIEDWKADAQISSAEGLLGLLKLPLMA